MRSRRARVFRRRPAPALRRTAARVARLGLLACAAPLAAASAAAGGAMPVDAPPPHGFAPLAAADARLDRGEVLVDLVPALRGGVVAQVRAVVEAPPEVVWPVIRDCQHHQEFLPRVEESERLEAPGGEGFVCRVVMDLPFPLADLWSESLSRVRELPGGGFERRWHLLRGSYARNEGYWRVIPWGPGAVRSLVVQHLELEPDGAVPDFVVRAAQERTAPQAMQAIRDRVRGLASGG